MSGKAEGSGAAIKQFLDSMVIDYEKWHDGVGYDLSAIDQMTPAEIESITKLLVSTQPLTWRELEALNHINTLAAQKAIQAALKHPSRQVRVAAARYAGNADDREAALIDALEHSDIYGGLSQTLDQIQNFHPPAIIDALLRGVIKRDGEAAVHFAAMLFYLHGKADSAFDWNHRPFFLKFHTTDRDERKALFAELCKTIGVDVDKYLF